MGGSLFLSDVCSCSQGALFCSAGTVDFPSNLRRNPHFHGSFNYFFVLVAFLNFKKTALKCWGKFNEGVCARMYLMSISSLHLLCS